MKHLAYLISLCLAALALSACSDRDDIFAEGADPQELTDLDARMSRATTVAALREYVGRHQFADKDVAVFTTIKRAINPIGLYTYHDIEFSCTATTDSKGNTSIGWSRIKNKGTTEEGNNEKYPDRIYWTDATNPHTFIGYCVPQQGGGGEFDWKHTEDTRSQPAVYYGSIGDPTASGPIDFSTRGTAPDTISGNVELRKNDILLTYSDSIKADDAIAKLYFHHGLAQVRVIVSISDFAAGGGDDTKSRVSDMTLKDMLMLYKWQQSSSETQYLLSDDQTNLNALYTPTVPQYDQRKDVKLWNPNADGIGEKSSRTFTYYGLAVPTEISADHPLAFSFKVTYPNPMHPETMVTKDYSGSIGSIRFDAGKCTTINIALNHRNEKMTVGAEYDEWDFIDTPDQGALKKNSTFLDTAARDSVTIFGDTKATVDDATWLYVDATTKELRDVYGHRGTSDDPFVISTARQLLSFAYEVTGTNRKAVKYKNIVINSEVPLAAGAGIDFAGYYVKLDADITIQPSSKIMHDKDGFYTGSGDSRKSAVGVTWPGIGDADHLFNGIFMGGSRRINRLYGNHFFHTLGVNAVVDKLNFDDVLELLGCGVVAHENNGLICSCYLDGDVTETNTETQYTGSIVGTNNSFVIACSHVGKVTGYGKVGGIVGFNNGTVIACYHAGGDVVTKTSGSGSVAYPTVGAIGDGTNGTHESIMFSSYYESNSFKGTAPSLVPGQRGYPLPTKIMQSSTFVTEGITSPSFIYEGGVYKGTGPILRDVAEKIVLESTRYSYTRDQISKMDNNELIALILPVQKKAGDEKVLEALSPEVLEVFKYHFSLNTAIRILGYWVGRLYAAVHADGSGITTVETNCHNFTIPQIDFLYQHYTLNQDHIYKYVPATYPRTQ